MKKLSILLLILIVISICGVSLYGFEPRDLESLSSFEAMKFQHVHEQGADLSCGLSVASSILNLYFNYEVDEDVLVDEFRDIINDDQRVSLADLQHVMTSYGYDSRVFKLNFENLLKAVNIYTPVVVHYDRPQPHFVIVFGSYENNLIIGDPAQGVYVLSSKGFLAQWSGVALVINTQNTALDLQRIENLVSEQIKRYKTLERRTRAI